jgi:hypothetical protein
LFSLAVECSRLGFSLFSQTNKKEKNGTKKKGEKREVKGRQSSGKKEKMAVGRLGPAE